MSSEKQKLPDNFAERYDNEHSIWRPIRRDKHPIVEEMRERLTNNKPDKK